MKASYKCVGLIKRSETFRRWPYLCPAGKATKGYGSTFNLDGIAVSMDDGPITEPQALELLYATLTQYEDAVTDMVTVDLTQGQFDALVDLAYNIGRTALRNSTLMKLLNEGDYAGAGEQISLWTHGGGHTLPGLVIRRAEDLVLWNSSEMLILNPTIGK